LYELQIKKQGFTTFETWYGNFIIKIIRTYFLQQGLLLTIFYLFIETSAG